ncbi:MAG TPA: hypothetical protein VFD92_03500 [Candidatus Binatia bacterium]|nr:hypothetical protein [Candidatus Binatia bacterium]
MALCVLSPRAARAEPYMAIREGRKCSSCHVNETGGGMRTLLANTHLQEITHYRDLFPEFAQAADAFNGQITSFLSIGGDLRVNDSIVFQDEPNAQGRVPNGKVFRSNVDENILEIREASFYALVGLIPDYLEVYTDISYAPGGTVAREVFGLMKGILPWRGYVKAGRFFLDYGLRTENDNLFALDNEANKIFVRGRTGTDFQSSDDGAEFALEPGPFHFSVSVTDGPPGDADVRVTTNAYAMLRDLPIVDDAIVGASFLHVAPQDQERYVYGFYAGANLGRFEYQGEVDWIHDSFSGTQPAVGTFLVYGELNYLLLDWINCKAFAEYTDNDSDATTNDDSQNRFGLGIEPFLGRFLQTRLFYSIANGPENQPPANQNRLVMEIHFFF